MAIHDDIMKRVRTHGRGVRIYTPKDFLDLASRAGVDQALSRLVKTGELRRVGRGLYDWPRHSAALDRPAPASVDAAVDAVRRRFNVVVLPGNLAAANTLGLTNAVPTQPDYVAKRAVGTTDLLARVRTHKQLMFRRGWEKLDEAVPGGIHLVPQDGIRADLEADYAAMARMMFGEAPEFEWVLEQLSALEVAINDE